AVRAAANARALCARVGDAIAARAAAPASRSGVCSNHARPQYRRRGTPRGVPIHGMGRSGPTAVRLLETSSQRLDGDSEIQSFQPSSGIQSMRHQKSGRKFNRTSAHRQVMFSNMAASLIKHEIIRTTLPKAKELRRVAEPLITLAKTDGVANRRLAFSRLRDKEAVGTLFTVLGPRYAQRPGG